jgi:hypothetical protein
MPLECLTSNVKPEEIPLFLNHELRHDTFTATMGQQLCCKLYISIYMEIFKVVLKISKYNKNTTYFLYFYNISIILTNKIIK